MRSNAFSVNGVLSHFTKLQLGKPRKFIYLINITGTINVEYMKVIQLIAFRRNKMISVVSLVFFLRQLLSRFRKVKKKR